MIRRIESPCFDAYAGVPLAPLKLRVVIVITTSGGKFSTDEPSSPPPHTLKSGQNVNSILRAVAPAPLYMHAIFDLPLPSPIVQTDRQNERSEASFGPDLFQMLNAPVLLHSQNVDPPQDSECEHAGYGTAPSFGLFDSERNRWTVHGYLSAESKGGTRPMPTGTGTVDDLPAGNHPHPLIHTPPHDHCVARYRAERAAYPGLSFLSHPVTDLSLHHAMNQSLGYSQSDEKVATSGELPFVHHASAAPTMGFVSTLPFGSHTSSRFDGRIEDPDGTRRCDRASGEALESDVSWSTPSKPVILAPKELYLSDHSSGENAQTPTDLSTPCSFCVETTMDTTVTDILHDSATGTTSGCIDDYAGMDLVSGQSMGSNLPSSSLSDSTPLSHEPRAFQHSAHVGGENLAVLLKPLAAENPHEDGNIYRVHTATCGWIKPNGLACNERIDYHCEDHFATAHNIKNLSSGAKIVCCWCPPSAQNKVRRKGFIRHIREAHMRCRRSKKKGGTRTLHKKKRLTPNILFSCGRIG
ncbi:hypothetical protein EDC04DRAFT_2624744 [Pisolithus marmoratus]|nr:hypothetical protein EDC04DRAFT_2624744 [Pisolithus marmoratus]